MSNKRPVPLITNKDSFDKLYAYTSDKLYFNIYKDGEPGLWHNTKRSAEISAGKDAAYRIVVKFKHK